MSALRAWLLQAFFSGLRLTPHHSGTALLFHSAVPSCGSCNTCADKAEAEYISHVQSLSLEGHPQISPWILNGDATLWAGITISPPREGSRAKPFFSSSGLGTTDGNLGLHSPCGHCAPAESGATPPL